MDTRWHEPRTVEEAIELRGEHGEDSVLVAGGTFLMLLIRTGLLFPQVLVNLGTIPGLDRIAVIDGELHLGPLVRHRQVEQSSLIRRQWPLLARTFAAVASPRVRNQATVGGVLADADYASDPPSTLIALRARVRLQGLAGMREIPVDSLILGHYETQIGPGEVLVDVVVPPATGHGRYLKFRSRSSEDRPCVGISATADIAADRTVRELRVVVGAVSERPQLFPEICDTVRGLELSGERIQQVADGYADRITPISDIRGSAAYRTRVTRALIRRTLAELAP